jgi:serine protease inhibitor
MINQTKRNNVMTWTPIKLPVLLACGLILLRETASAEPASTNEIARANNAFALSSYAQLAKKPGNLFFSPLSIHAVLTMIYSGAAGNTERQMAKVLHLDGIKGDVHEQYAALLRELKIDKNGKSPLIVANSIWADGRMIVARFERLVQGQYDSHVGNVDFRKSAETARQRINDWIAEKTSHRIEGMISPGALDASTTLVVANASFFDCDWQTKFPQSRTEDAQFHLISGEWISVAMMHEDIREWNYFENEAFQALELPYVADQFSMVILLPRKQDGLSKVEETLTAETIGELPRERHLRKVNVYLPKFRFACGFSLNSMLQDLGMTDAFLEEPAEFSGLSIDRLAYLKEVLHRSFINVNEEGTQAGAATVAIFTKGTSRAVVFNANHPFLFLIRHNPTGTILFLGRMANPLDPGTR